MLTSRPVLACTAKVNEPLSNNEICQIRKKKMAADIVSDILFLRTNLV